MDAGSSVQVAIRVRPMMANEAGSTQCVEVSCNSPLDPLKNVVRIGGSKGPTFCFDQAFDGDTPQEFIFQERISPLIDSLLEGYNATTLAYGQTGSGKTFTMTGPTTTMQDGQHAGIIPRSIKSLFARLTKAKSTPATTTTTTSPSKKAESESYDFEVRIQFLELYGEEIRDLLTNTKSKEKLTIRDIGMDEPEVLGATQHVVGSPEEALLCLARGMLRRVTGSTAMNAESSRSHAILSVLVEQSTTAPDGHASVVRSKFNFVDLAGSERQKRTQAVGQRLKEGIDINKGLLVLGNVISALGDPKKAGKTFVPYRDSKLTRLLKGSLGGNHKTLMIACVSPSSNNLDESLNCLRYANRAKNIQNNAVVNVDAATRALVELRAQVTGLATELLRIKQGGDRDEPNMYSIDMLEGLAKAKGGESKSGNMLTSPLRGVATPSKLGFSSPGFADPNQQSEQLRVTESLLEESQKALQKRTDELNSISEDLFTVRAEKEMYRLRLNGNDKIDMQVLEKATMYEKEIAALQEALQASNPMTVQDNADLLLQATKNLALDKANLNRLQSHLNSMSPPRRSRSSFESQSPPGSPEYDSLRTQVLESMSPSLQLDAEEKAMEEEIVAITKKFLSEDEEDAVPELESVLDVEESAEDAQRRQQLQVNLMELSTSIKEKESLIAQLEQSQKKYATMREFYEDKLRQMEEQVKERELEREALAAELEKIEKSTPQSKDLEQRLEEKDRHISGLRKRQNDLKNLTKVSSRNATEIDRLLKDIKTMKQKKVELQKLINTERKSHVEEINRLKKEVMQRDREANKWKNQSNKNAVQAEKAQQVAKSRLEQLGALKVRYTEAEKKLRVKTVKRGVMEKAGLDSVIVGRRAPVKKDTTTRGAAKAEIDVDSIRDYLDKKVSDIGKKEALADKLALEWEDHLELVSKREELSEQRITRATAESIKNLDAQIKYKEERIRRIAERLGKPSIDTSAPEKGEGGPEVLFNDDEFKRLLPDSSTLTGAKTTSRILFGMVVRERRRVASLARTASILNEKAKEAEHAVSEKEAAFLSFQDEERLERATLAQSQQEQILSLMGMVQGYDAPTALATLASGKTIDGLPTERDSSQNFESSRMAILANERIEALERQLEELRGERDSMEMYKSRNTKTRAELAKRTEECEQLREEAEQLREALRRVRTGLSRRKLDSGNQLETGEDDEEMEGSILATVSSAMKTSRRRSVANTLQGSNASKPVDLAQSDSDDEDESVPEWAGDIMADLAAIAEGQIPEALSKSATFEDLASREVDGSLLVTNTSAGEQSASKDQEGSVFDRLTNPNNFTGVQKRKNEHPRRGAHARDKRQAKSMEKGQEERKALSVKVTEQLEDFYHIKEDESANALSTGKQRKSKDPKEDGGERNRSVFERLLSPSNFTGTQKGKMRNVQAKKNHDADVLLDDLLDSAHGLTSPAVQIETQTHSKQQPDVDFTTQVANKVLEYTQKDVFERLNRTTTQSYAVKKNNPVVPARAVASPSPAISAEHETQEKGEAHHPALSAVDDLIGSPTRDRSSYTQLNVFERLQKTTTEAFAHKTHVSHDYSAPINRVSSSPTNSDKDDHNGVFERLQNTTTQSFAVKHQQTKQDVEPR